MAVAVYSPRLAEAWVVKSENTEAARVAQVFRELRQRAGLTQDEAARKAGLSIQGYRPYEQAGRELTLSKVAHFARVFGVSTTDLLARLGFEPPTADTDLLNQIMHGLGPDNADLAIAVFERIHDWPPADQRAVLENLDALIDAEQRRRQRRNTA